jgi:hypothetical protein
MYVIWHDHKNAGDNIRKMPGNFAPTASGDLTDAIQAHTGILD